MRVLRYILGAGLAAAVFLVAAPSAHAVTFTFAAPGASVPLGFTPCFSSNNDRCGATLTFRDIVSGVEVEASSQGTPPGHGFDDMAVIQDLNPVDGGLGVVYTDDGVPPKFIDGAEHDEINEGQTLILTFNQEVFLDTLTFFDSGHNDLDHDGTFMFAVNGGGFMEREFDYGFSGTQGTSFSFMYGGHENEDFYLASVIVEPVPEPATLLLFGSGLTGLVLRRRRTRS